MVIPGSVDMVEYQRQRLPLPHRQTPADRAVFGKQSLRNEPFFASATQMVRAVFDKYLVPPGFVLLWTLAVGLSFPMFRVEPESCNLPMDEFVVGTYRCPS